MPCGTEECFPVCRSSLLSCVYVCAGVCLKMFACHGMHCSLNVNEKFVLKIKKKWGGRIVQKGSLVTEKVRKRMNTW